MPFLAAIPAATAIGAGVQAVGGIAGAVAAGSEREKAERAQAQAIQQLQAIGIPSVEAQQIVLQNPEFVAQWATQQEQAQEIGPSAMEGVSTDPRLGLAQMQALERMQQLGVESFTPEEMAQLKGMQRESAQRGAAQQATILQNLAQRGAGGSGMELAARMAAAQGQTQQEAESSDRLAAQAHNRALQAMLSAGELGGKVREQEFGEKSAAAKAADAIAQFNAQQRSSAQMRNVEAANRAAESQALQQQRMEEERARIANLQEMQNKSLLQQQFQNQMSKAQAMQAPLSAQAASQQKAAAATGAGIAGALGGIGSAIGSFVKPTASIPDTEQRTAEETAEDTRLEKRSMMGQ